MPPPSMMILIVAFIAVEVAKENGVKGADKAGLGLSGIFILACVSKWMGWN